MDIILGIIAGIYAQTEPEPCYLKRRRNVNGYIAIYNNKQIDIHAESLYSAKLKAVAELRVPKSKQHMVSVMLAEIDNKPVIHIAVY
jgi:hypothetical protein